MTVYVGFTGTRHQPTEAQKNTLVDVLTGFREGGIQWMRNGDCKGADEYSGRIWVAIGGRIHLHPPSNSSKRAFLDYAETERPKPYLARNRDIVDGCTLLVATPFEMIDQFRGGTWSTVHYARSLKRPVMIIRPDGTTSVENWPVDPAKAMSAGTAETQSGSGRQPASAVPQGFASKINGEQS